MEQFAQGFLKCQTMQNLLKQIQSNSFGQAHIVVSPDDFSNKLFSKILGFSLVCENLCYCDKCEQCAKLESGTHPDLKIFDNPKGFAVGDVKEILDDVYKSAYAKNKVYIINCIDIATIPAQNKLLKILEEPPKNVYFILNAVNTSNILATILSRVIKINLLPFDFESLCKIFAEAGLNPTENAVAFGEGYVGKVLNFLQNENFQRVYNCTYEILEKVKKSSEIIEYSENIKKEDMSIFLQALQTFLTDILYIKTQNEDFVKSSYKSGLKKLADEFSLGAIAQICQNIIVAKQHLEANVNFSVIKDKLLLSILEAKYIFKN